MRDATIFPLNHNPELVGFSPLGGLTRADLTGDPVPASPRWQALACWRRQRRGLTAVLLLVGLGFGLGGCASTGEPCRAPLGDAGLTPAVAAASPAHIGARVTWGGTLVEVRNLERVTEIEVVGLPLDRCGRPRPGERSVGRFIILRAGYLEAASLSPGREITASGRITGTREGSIGDAFYRFPLLEDANPTVWPLPAAETPWSRSGISIGIGAGTGWSGGGVGIRF